MIERDANVPRWRNTVEKRGTEEFSKNTGNTGKTDKTGRILSYVKWEKWGCEMCVLCCRNGHSI